jgi:CDP-diacylglycerol--glycerol-3-phosphate 3-phosphatidyltransferase
MPVNLPNLLTILRILLIAPLTAAFLADQGWGRWVALALYAAASATDWLDGYLARRLNQGTALGRMLDPIADKLLVATVLLLLAATGGVGGWNLAAALAILLREIAVSGFREHLGPLDVVVPVSRLAKWKTATQLLALGFLIAPLPAVQPYGIGLLWIAAALTLITGWTYLKATLSAIA